MDRDELLERKAIEVQDDPPSVAQAKYDAYKKYAGLSGEKEDE